LWGDTDIFTMASVLFCETKLVSQNQGDLLKAGPKLGSSFAWHSIVAGLQTFKQAHIWRVESGSRMGISLDCNNPTHIMLEYGA
jgi:hypothetical protein